MTLEASIYAALGPLVGNRCRPDLPQAPAVPTWPSIRYSFITSLPDVDLCGSGGDDTAITHVQLDIIATTRDAARAIRLQVMSAMNSFTPPAIREADPPSGDDPDYKVFIERLEYSIHASST